MRKGFWFFGYSGCGKTFASKFLKKKIKKSVIIDGDKVRKYISYDLSYTKKDRSIQIERVYGLALILIEQDIFPIISTVFFNNKIYKECKKLNITPIKIERSNIKSIISNHPTYKNKKNIVGKDIFYEKMRIRKITNDGSKNFCKVISSLIL
jgi:hypothetical protein